MEHAQLPTNAITSPLPHITGSLPQSVGSLVYDIRKYVLRVPFLGLIIGFPTWVSPFGGGCTTETGESEASFSVNFEMTHPVFGRTIGYSGRCRMSSS